jgi:hypothetical protein
MSDDQLLTQLLDLPNVRVTGYDCSGRSASLSASNQVWRSRSVQPVSVSVKRATGTLSHS